MSGASGKVPAAIHVTPEAADGGPIARIRDGDMIRIDADKGTLEVLGGCGRICRPSAGHRRSFQQSTGARGVNSLPPSADSPGRADQGASIFEVV